MWEVLIFEDSDCWMADSGATDHITHHSEWFQDFQRFNVPLKVYISDKSTMDTLGRGTIRFEALVNAVWKSSYISNVLYIPNAHRNLFLVTSAPDKGMSFNLSKCVNLLEMEL